MQKNFRHTKVLCQYGNYAMNENPNAKNVLCIRGLGEIIISIIRLRTKILPLKQKT